ncbi:MAG: peptidylprolyl isomerase, partial [Bacteroides sp.]
MNKKIYLLPLLLLVALFTTSCEETKEAGKYDNWQARSEAFIDSIAGVYAAQTDATPEKDRLYAFVDQYNQSQTIYVKKFPLAEGTVLGETPLYTAKISVYYRMSFFNGDVIQETFSGADPEPF